MKKVLSIMLAVCLLLSASPFMAMAADAPSSWAAKEVAEAKELGLLTDRVQKGYTTSITREEFCEVIVKLCEKVLGKALDVPEANPFKDTTNTEVLKANKFGVVNGTAADKFSPASNITRQEIATMMVRAANGLQTALGKSYVSATDEELALITYNDISSIASWALPQIKTANLYGIMLGTGAGKISPLANSTKEQAILLALRLYKVFDPTVSRYKAVSASDGVSFGLKEDGTLWVWGRNIANELGLPDVLTQTAPAKLMDDVKSFGTSSYASFAIKNDGSLYIWGIDDISEPTKLLDNVKEAKVGDYQLLILKDDKTLWTCDEADAMETVKLLDNVAFIEASYNNSFAIQADGTLWGWGDNESMILSSSCEEVEDAPVKITDGVSSVSASSDHVLVLKTDGSLWGMGQNDSNKINTTKITEIATLTKIMDGVTSAYATDIGSFAIKDGDLWNSASETKIADDVKGISYGVFNNIILILKNDGSMWKFGDESSTSAGYDLSKNYKEPVKLTDGVKTAAAASHYLILKRDGSLYTYGNNDYGQLGNGKSLFSNELVTLETDVADIKISSNFSMMLKKDGSVWAWGENADGTLGDGTTVSKSQPVKIFDDAKKIELGLWNGYIIKNDGTLWVCNNSILDDTAAENTKPVQIMDNVAEVTAGIAFGYALKTDGSVWKLAKTPSKVIEDKDIISIREYIGMLYVLKKDGTLSRVDKGALVKMADDIIKFDVANLVMLVTLSNSGRLSFNVLGILEIGKLDNIEDYYSWGDISFVVTKDSKFGYGVLKTDESDDFEDDYRYDATKDIINIAVSKPASGSGPNIKAFAGDSETCYMVDADGNLWGWGLTRHTKDPVYENYFTLQLVK